MNYRQPGDDDDSFLMDARKPGTFSTVYTVIAVLVVLALVIGIGGQVWWHWFQ